MMFASQMKSESDHTGNWEEKNWLEVGSTKMGKTMCSSNANGGNKVAYAALIRILPI